MSKYGFILNGKFYSNSGYGHEANARAIVQKNGWTSNRSTYQDYLVLERGAIQIGSDNSPNAIIASACFHTWDELESIGKIYCTSPQIIMY